MQPSDVSDEMQISAAQALYVVSCGGLKAAPHEMRAPIAAAINAMPDDLLRQLCAERGCVMVAKSQEPTKRDPVRESEAEAAIYWNAFVRAVSTRGCALSCSTNERGRTSWECTTGRSTVARRSPESALWGALQLEFDGNVPEGFGLQKSTLRKLVFSGADSAASDPRQQAQDDGKEGT